MVKQVEIREKSEFEKLKELGTVYKRTEKTVIATTVGVTENADTNTVDEHKVEFVYNRD